MLHGYGSDENDLFAFSSELDERYFVISVRAPLQMMPFGNAWYTIHFDAPQGKWTDTEQALNSRELIKDFINQACETYPVDPSNVSLIGFSQGTILSLAVALSYPKLIKNVVALSGYVNKDLVEPQSEADFSHLDVFASHGLMDQVIPVEWARQTPSFLDARGIKHVYHEYPVGHGVSPENFYAFKSWLEQRT